MNQYNGYNPNQYRYYNWPGQEYNNNWNNHHSYRRVTIVEAMNIALERIPGQVVKIELETRGGKLIYEVEIVTAQGVKYEIDVDVDTGQILKVELD